MELCGLLPISGLITDLEMLPSALRLLYGINHIRPVVRYQRADPSTEDGTERPEGCADLAARETRAKSMGATTTSGNTDSDPGNSANDSADHCRFTAAPSGLPVSFKLCDIFSLLRGRVDGDLLRSPSPKGAGDGTAQVQGQPDPIPSLKSGERLPRGLVLGIGGQR
jgi:hypothetical protein